MTPWCVALVRRLGNNGCLADRTMSQNWSFARKSINLLLTIAVTAIVFTM